MKKSKKVTLLLATMAVLPLVGCEKKPQRDFTSGGWDNPTPAPNGTVVTSHPWYYFGHGGTNPGAAAANNGFVSNPPVVGGAQSAPANVSRGGFGTTGHGFSAGS